MENTNSRVKLIRTMSGEYFLGKSVSETTDGKKEYSDARKLSMGMTMSGEMQVALIPICPFSIKKIETLSISDSQILYELDEDDIQKELVTSYKSEISGIAIPPKGPDIII